MHGPNLRTQMSARSGARFGGMAMVALAATVAGAMSCRPPSLAPSPSPAPAPSPFPGSVACRVKHAAASSEDRAHASDVCDGAVLPDLSQLPPELAGAGCTTLGTYQLGLGHKSLRYAICAAASTDCACPIKAGTPHACTTPLGRFVACHKGEDLAASGLPLHPYGWAHVVTHVCDACLGNSVPAGMVIVAWHEAAVCAGDAGGRDGSAGHDARIQAAVPGSTPAPHGTSGGSEACPQSGCVGGCMAPGQPQGL
jgi:hypothetical protein